MASAATDAYLESEILSADPVTLVRLLYANAIAAVRHARRHLAAGDIRERSRTISRAIEIVAELTASLNTAGGGEIAQRLAALYDYIGRRLIEANCRQTDAPLAESLSLLLTLADAWEKTAPAPAPPAYIGAAIRDAPSATQTWVL